jgi:hypothetical protein
MKRQLVCFCEHRFEAELPDAVDLGREPEVEEAILQGDFLAVRCPKCGKLLKPEFPVRIVDPQMEVTLWFIPELDRGAFFRGALTYDIGGADRVAIGYDELAEKMLLRRNRLDDRAVEIVKYYLLNKILQSYEGESEIRILFSHREGETLFFNALGLKEGEVGVLKVSAAMVEKAAGQIEQKRTQEPFDQILKGPYVSVNTLYTEGEE